MKSLKSKEVADALIRRIRNSHLQDGDTLVGERDLAEEFEISRGTMRSSLKILVDQNWLKPVQGRGYVIQKIPEMPLHPTMNIAGIWVKELDSSKAMELFTAASSVAEEQGYHLFLNGAAADERCQAAKIARILDSRPDGIMIVPVYAEKTGMMTLGNYELMRTIRRSGIPLMLINRPFPEEDLPCVVNDDAMGGEMAADYFIGLGVKRVARLDRTRYYISELRNRAFEKKCREAGIEVVKIPNPFSGIEQEPPEKQLERRRRFRQMMLKERIEGMFFGKPPILEALILDFEDTNIHLLCYDCVEYAPVWGGVASVVRPQQRIAERGMERLLKQIKGCDDGPLQEKIPPQIIRYQEIERI